jgi:hypothetical protein
MVLKEEEQVQKRTCWVQHIWIFGVAYLYAFFCPTKDNGDDDDDDDDDDE